VVVAAVGRTTTCRSEPLRAFGSENNEAPGSDPGGLSVFGRIELLDVTERLQAVA